jgi:hypothetical protein
MASIGAGADKARHNTSNTVWPPGGAFATEKRNMTQLSTPSSLHGPSREIGGA